MERVLPKGQIPKVVLPISVRMGEEASAFARGAKERPLRVVVDSDTTPPGQMLDILRSFAAHPLLDIYSTQADGGPHIEVGQIDESRDMAPVVLTGKETSTLMGVPSAHRKVELAKEIGSESVGEEEVVRLLFLASAGYSVGADALATGSHFLLAEAPRGVVARSNPMTVEEAVALLGLFLRLRDDFVIEIQEKLKSRLDRGLFYLVLTRELLPAGWRWVSACVESWSATGNDTTELLGGSAVVRFDRALRARDRLQEQFQLPQTNNTMDEALFYLDVALLELAGVFDAVARVAHIAYGLSGSAEDASWRRERWRGRLGAQTESLAAAMDEKQPDRDALELVALLRNTIHGAALRGITFEQFGGGRKRESLVIIPKKEQDRFADAVARLGGDEHWGVRSIQDGSLYLDPHNFVEALIPAAAGAINRLMEATEVERLPGVTADTLLTGPPEGDSPFKPAVRKRVRALGGF